MPMYDWKCEHDHITNTICSVADFDKPPEKCDSTVDETDEKHGVQKVPCPSTKFTKVIGGGNFILMGYGWARDGYQ